MSNIVVGIPARFTSTRFPGKPLARLGGIPMIEHVYRQAAAVPRVDRVLVATDDQRIVSVVEGFGGEVRLTRADHVSGSDRLAELFETVACEVVVNLQGDEPLLGSDAIGLAIEAFLASGGGAVATLKTRIRDRRTLLDTHAVKVTTGQDDYALSFSREPEPLVAVDRDWDPDKPPYFKHIGLYVFGRPLLLSYPRLTPSVREQEQKLEQYRFLDNGFKITVVECEQDSIGVDTPEDLVRAEAEWQRLHAQ